VSVPAPLRDRVGLTRAGPVLTGTAATVSARLGADVGVVRVAAAVLVPAAGAGLVLYLLAWLLLVAGREPEPGVLGADLRRNLGVVTGTAGILLIVRDVVGGFPDTLVAALALVGFALALADPAGARTAGRAELVRMSAGVVLMVGGFTAALATSQSLAGVWTTLVAALVLTAGVALVAAPFVQRLAGDAAIERRERIRAEERADLAAHLHDSVLQTLTLIQNRAGDPQVAAALARQQERELRRWLYADHAAGPCTRFRDALEAAAAEVEGQYLVTIECIVVGDADLDARLAAVVAAAREAMINAAKFSGLPVVSVYAELVDGRVEVFVRDRGAGFDPAAVPGDRRGIRDSIVARIDRLEGRTRIRSQPGAGTEVFLEVPLR
jgi:signal transduction histidine kinase